MSDGSYLRELPQNAEVRNRTAAVEMREHEDGELPEVEGHAATFNQPYDLGPFREQIDPRAFDDVMEDDVLALVNHDVNRPLARTDSPERPLSLSVDERGLVSRFPIPEHADDVRQDLADGVLRDMSFAFTVAEESWERNEDDKDLRTIEEVDRLFDVSIVANPANPNTDVALRSRQAWVESRSDGVVEDRASEPVFDSTEDVVPGWVDEGTWDFPNLNTHPEVGEDETWPDLSEDTRQTIADRFIEGTADVDTYRELGNPVVNPATDNLNRNGVLAARQRPASDEAEDIADALWEEHFADEESNSDDLRRRKLRWAESVAAD